MLAELPWSTLGMSRIANETGAGALTFSAEDAKVPAVFADIEPWAHDLVLYRIDEHEPVFAGPVRTVTYRSGLVSLTAKDVTSWLERRRIFSNTTYPNVDLAYIWAAIAGEAMEQDSSPNPQIVVGPCGVVGTRITRTTERALAADLLRELSRSGVDWTTVARKILVGGSDLTDSFGALLLIDEHVDDPVLTKAGDVTTTQQSIRWQAEDDQEPMITTVRAISANTLGLLEDLDEEADIADSTSAGAAAQARLDLRSRNPRVVTAGLDPDAPTTVARLVPGRIVDWRVSTLPVMTPTRTRLVSMAAKVDQDSEVITVETTPVGATNE